MNISKYLLSALLLSMFLFIACDESEDVQRYEQEVLTASDNPLTYTNLTSYPLVGAITSTVPTGDFDTPYRYRLLNATSTTGSSFSKAAFTVDGGTGAIAYGNAGNTINRHNNNPNFKASVDVFLNDVESEVMQLDIPLIEINNNELINN